MNNVQTQCKIIDIKDDNNWRYSIDAEIPAFGNRPFRFMTWRKTQGDPPDIDSVVMGEFSPYRRSPYYIKRGDVAEGEPDGTEQKYHLDWNMVGFSPLEEPNATTPSNSPASTPNTPLTATSSVSGGTPTVFLDATHGTRVREETINDREAVRNAIAMHEPGALTVEGLLSIAEPIAAWYNTRLTGRLGSGLPQAAQAAGATLVRVEEEEPPQTIEDILGSGEPPAPQVRSNAELLAHTKSMGWTKEQIATTLQGAGFATAAEYLAMDGNSVQGLAELLHDKLA